MRLAGVPSRDKLLIVILVLLVASLIGIGALTLGTVDRYFETARSVRGLEISIGDVRWDPQSRRLEMEIVATNGGGLDIFLDDIRFSVYIDGVYVATNTDTRMGKLLDPTETATFTYAFTLRPFFADEIDRGLDEGDGTWGIRGVVWVDVDGLRSDIPVAARKDGGR